MEQMSEPIAEPSVTPQTFERILAAHSKLVALRVNDVTRTIAQCRHAALRSGQAIYLWQPASGLVSLRDADVQVPTGHGLADALQHVLQSIHFGIYLFDGFQTQMGDPVVRLMRRIAREETDNDRKLVFIADHFAFVPEIDTAIEFMRIPNVETGKPRLRGGHWVV